MDKLLVLGAAGALVRSLFAFPLSFAIFRRARFEIHPRETSKLCMNVMKAETVFAISEKGDFLQDKGPARPH